MKDARERPGFIGVVIGLSAIQLGSDKGKRPARRLNSVQTVTTPMNGMRRRYASRYGYDHHMFLPAMLSRKAGRNAGIASGPFITNN